MPSLQILRALPIVSLGKCPIVSSRRLLYALAVAICGSGAILHESHFGPSVACDTTTVLVTS